jgi:AcrR family transcriptional regulator
MSKARDRLLETAARLFYAEGIHTVGVDRVIAEAGVAKATFYHHFKSKDDLVVAYLVAEYERQRGVLGAVEGQGRAAVHTILDRLADLSRGPGFRGCPFLNAAAEFSDPGHPVRAVVDDYRDWYRSLMSGLLRADGVPPADAERLADYLLLLRDGLTVSGGLGDDAAVRAGVDAAVRTLG